MKNWQTPIVLFLAFILGTLTMTSLSGCQKVPRETAKSHVETDDLDLDVSISESNAAVDTAEGGEQTEADDAAAEESVSSDSVPVSSEAETQETSEAGVDETSTATSAPRTTAAAVSNPVDKTANATIEPGDWRQWGGTSYRNNTPIGTNIPTDWAVGKFDRKTQEWIPDEARNIKWVARVGSQTYGNPVVSGGRVFIGTNNQGGWVNRYPSEIDLGCLICFDEEDGSFLWQDSSEKLPTGRVHDWPYQGICCAPLVEGERLWFVTSRGEVKCLDTQGYYDGEDDGPVQNQLVRLFDVMQNEDASKDRVAPIVAALGDGELNDTIRELFAARGAELPSVVGIKTETPGKKWAVTASVGDAERSFQVTLTGTKLSAFKLVTANDKHESDTIWVYDMMGNLAVSQHNMCSCSVTALGDILFVNTSNGVEEFHNYIPSPDAPSFIAMDKNTGEVLWTDKSPGLNILHGQWSSPTVATLGGVPQVIFGGGDGWVYSFSADKGKDGKPELLWTFDANPKESEWILGGRGTRNNIIATPVVYDGLVYVAVGQDPEHGEADGHLWCLNPNKRGDVSPELAMKIEGDKRTPLAHRRLQAVNPEDGEVAVDNENSAVVWHYSQSDQNGDGKFDFEETMHRSCGTVAIKDDLLFISDFSGLFHCLDAKTGEVHWTHDMLAAAWGSPLIVDGYVYVGDEDGDVSIFRLSADPKTAMKKVEGELWALNADEEGYPTNMGNSVYSTPIVANNVLFIANRTHLFAIAPDKDAAE